MLITDRLHKSQFNMQCKILRHLFSLVDHGKITSPLWNPQQATGIASNQQYVRVYLANMLSKSSCRHTSHLPALWHGFGAIEW